MTVAYNPAAEDERRQPLRTDIAYAAITLGSTVLWSILGGWLLYFYLPPDGEGSARVPIALYGVAMLIARAVNAIITPLIGYLSDNARSHWGRRLPFMFFSALPMLFFFALAWRPPVQGESIWNLVYLMTVMGFYNVAYVFNQIPYTALLPELAVTDRHRVRMSGWTASCMLLGMMAGGLAGSLIERVGYVRASLIYVAALLPVFYLPFLVLRERPGRQIHAAERLDLRQSAQAMLRNRPFLILTAAGMFYWGVTALIQAVVPYIATEICLLSTAETMLLYIPAILASLVCYPAITWLAGRFGKGVVFRGSLLASAIVLPGLAVIGDWGPLSLKVQGTAWITLQAVAMSGVIMLQPALGAEVTDYDEDLTGQRREGTYYATWGLLDQVINGLVLGLLPLLLLLGRSRSDPSGPLGVRMVGVVGGCLFLLAFLIFLRYPSRRSAVGQEAA